MHVTFVAINTLQYGNWISNMNLFCDDGKWIKNQMKNTCDPTWSAETRRSLGPPLLWACHPTWGVPPHEGSTGPAHSRGGPCRHAGGPRLCRGPRSTPSTQVRLWERSAGIVTNCNVINSMRFIERPIVAYRLRCVIANLMVPHHTILILFNKNINV